MTTATLLIITGVVIAFGAFALTLAGVDFASKASRKPIA